MKGRTPTKAEKLFWNNLCSIVGCIACRKDGRFNNWCVPHHIDGRTKPGAHMKVIPLCEHHHQGKGVKEIPAVHVNKAAFEQKYGKQEELLAECHSIINEEKVT